MVAGPERTVSVTGNPEEEDTGTKDGGSPLGGEAVLRFAQIRSRLFS
jgi:hypothetical protein